MVEGPIKISNLEEELTGCDKALSNLNFLALMKGRAYSNNAADSDNEHLPVLQIGQGENEVSAKILKAAEGETGTNFKSQPGNFDDAVSKVLDLAGFNLPSTFNSTELENSLLQNGFTVAGSDVEKAKPGDIVLTFNADGRGTDASIVGDGGQSYGVMPQRNGTDEWVEFPSVVDTGRTVVLSPPRS